MVNQSSFSSARRHLRLLWGWGAALAAAGAMLTPWGITPGPSGRFWAGVPLPNSVGLSDLGASGPALLLGAAALLAAGAVAWSRHGVLVAVQEAEATGLDNSRTLRRAALRARWPQNILVVLLASSAAAAAAMAARTAVPLAADILAGALCLAAAFALLVLERHLSALAPAELPEADEAASVLRVPVATLVVVGAALLLQALGYRFLGWTVRGASVFVAFAALEVAVRATAGLFLPPAPPDAPRYAVRSSLARLIRAAPPSLSALGSAIEQQFGIDLSRSWALGFLRRAALPALAGIGFAGWLLTGLTALRMDERAVYHRLGTPAAVLAPGLHAHLPWPFGTIRKVELDVMHEVPLTLAESGRRVAVAAEAKPPPSADRLWNEAHPSEATYLLADVSGGRQGFQVLDIDLRLVFRVGASDAAARASVLQAEAPDRLVRAVAGRVLVRYFASRTVAGVLGVDRDAFASEVRGAVQTELDTLGTGLDLVAVVVEAVHPPPAAAAAYQGVQASEVRAREAVSVQQAGAAQTAGTARISASDAATRAQATAAEALNEARVQATLSGADRTAHAQHAASFLFERRMERLGPGLARGQALILDHRLQDDALTLDMRPAAPPTP